MEGPKSVDIYNVQDDAMTAYNLSNINTLFTANIDDDTSAAELNEVN